MELKDFMDMSKLQKIQDDFSNATGLAAIAVGMHGEYLTEGSNFTDFCMKYTKESAEGNKRCVKCDNECSWTYFCHAGLMDFSVDIKIGNEKVGTIVNQFVNLEYFKYNNVGRLEVLQDEVSQSEQLTRTINDSTSKFQISRDI